MISDKKPLIKRLDSIIPSTVKPIRFINWMMKNNISLRDYEDYQEMVEALGIPFDGDYVVIPKNWENKHTRDRRKLFSSSRESTSTWYIFTCN